MEPACTPTPEDPSRDDNAAREQQRLRDIAEHQERARRAELWSQSGIPARHRQALNHREWDWTPDQQPAVARARQVVEAGGLLILLGPFGTGKTHLACGLIAHTCTKLGRSARYWRFADLLSEMRDECYQRGGSDAALMQRLARLGLVVIDELHHRRWTQDEQLWLTRLLDHRYGEMTPTILVANLTPDDMASSLDPAVADRLHQAGAVVELNGESRRGEQP